MNYTKPYETFQALCVQGTVEMLVVLFTGQAVRVASCLFTCC